MDLPLYNALLQDQGKIQKFHLVEAAFKTSLVFIPNLLKIMLSSFINAIFKSLCEFSITFAASIFMLDTLNVPALIIFLYN